MTSIMYCTRLSIWPSWRMLRRRSKIAAIPERKLCDHQCTIRIHRYPYSARHAEHAWQKSATKTGWGGDIPFRGLAWLDTSCKNMPTSFKNAMAICARPKDKTTIPCQ